MTAKRLNSAMAISDTGDITINRLGGTVFRFDTTGVIDPSTYQTAPSIGDVVWTLVVEKEFTLPLPKDDTDPAIRWFRFTASHAADLGKSVRAYQIVADFGSGPYVMGSGKISAEGFAA